MIPVFPPNPETGPRNRPMTNNKTPQAPRLEKGLPTSPLVHIEAWIFDLDNTLYPASSNLFGAIDQRMKAFIAAELDVTPDEAWRIQKTYFRQYGTTLRGLMLKHATDPSAFLDYVHDVDLGLLDPAPVLARALDQLEGKKIVYTNGCGNYARKVLDQLGIEHLFDGIFDITAADFIPKPEPAPYNLLLSSFNIHPHRAAFFEDIPHNLKPAADLGMTTIWVQNDTPWAETSDDIDHIDHITDDLVGWIRAILDAREPTRPLSEEPKSSAKR